MPFRVAAKVAQRAARAVTEMARADYTSGNTCYGDDRSGDVSLVRTGATLATVRFEALGQMMRCVLGTPWSKYLIGKYRILPHGGAAMPTKWFEAIRAIANQELARDASDTIARAA